MQVRAVPICSLTKYYWGNLMKNNWNKQELIAALTRLVDQEKIFQWKIVREENQRRERYFIGVANKATVDQARIVTEKNFYVALECLKEGDKLGSASAKLFASEALDPQLDALLASAQLGETDKWSYPEKKQDFVEHIDIDTAIAENIDTATEEIQSGLLSEVEKIQKQEFNSAELFVTKKTSEVTLSSGFERKTTRSNIYVEVCFSDTDQSSQLSEEYMVTKWAVAQDQLPYNALVNTSAELASASLNTSTPKSGRYSVILDARILSQLWHDAVSHTFLANKYLGLPFIASGENFIPKFTGEPFTLSLDPQLKNCLESASYSAEGLSQEKLNIVRDNKVLVNPATKMYADYLKQQPTSHLGAISVKATGMPLADLKKLDKKVLEILQFSALFSNRNDLTYASEIRLGRLYDNETGEVSYIKGGSLSGNFKANFAGVRWSDTLVLDNHVETMGSGLESYYGPSHALIPDVSISS